VFGTLPGDAGKSLADGIDDRQYTETPFYGSRKMVSHLRREGFEIGRKRVMHLMRLMGIRGIAPGPDTSRKHPRHQVYPYLLSGVTVERANHVWSSDVTYLRMKRDSYI
jgi:putative transposase